MMACASSVLKQSVSASFEATIFPSKLVKMDVIGMFELKPDGS
jgi:hypothetical protein